MLFGDAADLQRDQVAALGHQHRRLTRYGVVLERHREMRRVRDHHIRRGHSLHHPPLCHLALQSQDAALDLRPSLAVLHLIPDFLPGHHLLPIEIPQFERHVEHDDQDHRETHRQQTPLQNDHGVPERLRGGKAAQRNNPVQHQTEEDDRRRAQHPELDDRLDQFQQSLGRHDPAQSLERAQLLQLERHGIQAERPAAYQQWPDHDAGNQHCEQGRQDAQRRHYQADQSRREHRLVKGQVPVDSQGGLEQIGKVARHMPAKRHQAEAANQQGQHGIELFGARHLAFFPRFLFSPFGGLFCTFLRCLLLGHEMS